MANLDGAGGEANRPLTGWKAIAGYFGKDERTVRRWAANRGLPVHRVKGDRSSSVFAYVADLNRWLVSHSHMMESPPVEPPASRRRGTRWIAALCSLCLGLGLVGTMGWRLLQPPPGLPPAVAVSSAESLYLDGVYHLETRTADGITRSLGLFAQTILADPGFTLAYVGLAAMVF